MNADELATKYRPLFLGWLTEAFALRHASPSSFGMLVDRRFGQLEDLIRRMHADAQPPPPKPTTNGNGHANGNGNGKAVLPAKGMG